MQDKVLLGHGSGGRLTHNLIREVLLPALTNPVLARMDDSAVVDLNGRLAFTTDSYVVTPLFFPGGDIGKLSVCGTVNDLAMCGATPLYLSLSLIIEEGFPFDDLGRIIRSVRKAADEAKVSIATGDTKVVEKGSADGIFITTSGIGVVADGHAVSGSNARAGDKVIISGTIGDHGIAVMSQKEGLKFSVPVESDCAPLSGLVARMLDVAPSAVHAMRDPTRGGLATTLVEIAGQSQVGIEIEESRIPVRESVRAACELLGLDPLYVANEGKLVAMVSAESADEVLSAMKRARYGTDAAVIGEVTSVRPGRVTMRTAFGTSRILDMLSGELLPRIC